MTTILCVSLLFRSVQTRIVRLNHSRTMLISVSVQIDLTALQIRGALGTRAGFP